MDYSEKKFILCEIPFVRIAKQASWKFFSSSFLHGNYFNLLSPHRRSKRLEKKFRNQNFAYSAMTFAVFSIPAAALFISKS